VWTGTLATMGVRDRIASRRDPGVLVIGNVVSQAHTVARDAVLTFAREEFSCKPLMTRKR